MAKTLDCIKGGGIDLFQASLDALAVGAAWYVFNGIHGDFSSYEALNGLLGNAKKVAIVTGPVDFTFRSIYRYLNYRNNFIFEQFKPPL